jgi:adenylylsulfate kinase
MSDFITIHPTKINLPDREMITHHQPAVLWFTGLSGSGKSTIANEVEYILNKKYFTHTYLLDGDNIRKGLNKDLGFSFEDRKENIRRIGEVAHLFYRAGLIVLTAFISPFREDRDLVRSMIPDHGFIEIFVKCPLKICEQRDPKKLYQKAKAGEIREFTGIDSPYEEPLSAEIILETDKMTLAQCTQVIISYLKEHQYLR